MEGKGALSHDGTAKVFRALKLTDTKRSVSLEAIEASADC